MCLVWVDRKLSQPAARPHRKEFIFTEIVWQQFTISLLAKYDLEIGVSSIGMFQDIWLSEDLELAGMIVD